MALQHHVGTSNAGRNHIPVGPIAEHIDPPASRQLWNKPFKKGGYALGGIQTARNMNDDGGVPPNQWACGAQQALIDKVVHHVGITKPRSG